MSEAKIKIKIGEHEFEAEGSSELVQEQFASFKELVAMFAAKLPPPSAAQPMNGTPPPTQSTVSNTTTLPLPLDKIMQIKDRLIWLTVHAESVGDAIMVLLLGHRVMRNNDSVTGADIMDGLRESGNRIPRVDYVLDKLAANGSVITIGERRARRYRLTAVGVNRAVEIAQSLIAMVP